MRHAFCGHVCTWVGMSVHVCVCVCVCVCVHVGACCRGSSMHALQVALDKYMQHFSSRVGVISLLECFRQMSWWLFDF